ncbi:MAG: hypothetical protein QXW97_04625 [Candidatus Pacearchaeota archaeon]
MGFLSFLKRESVPEELPDLVTDDTFEKNSESSVQSINLNNNLNTKDLNKNEVNQKISKSSLNFDDSSLVNEKNSEKNNSEIEIIKDFTKDFTEDNNKANTKSFLKSESEINSDKNEIRVLKNFSEYDSVNNEGFFVELENNINKEINDLNKLESWYKNKFLPRDVVSEMRRHWESKKNISVINILGKNFKERINEKTLKLQQLEREWQNIYFDLIEKEEEIRKYERELKKMLAEFLELCKMKNKTKQEKK